jgi:3-deoxy-D-manno-octulosonate 8-phosphate phosphatase (KDO 8-P phosphatase)
MTPSDPIPRSPERIELLGLDVDGVLTDGSIYLDDDGRETKRFNVRDGFGIRLWQKMGFRVAIITGRSGRAVQHRAAELGIELLTQGAADKVAAAEALAEETGLRLDQMAYLGDDWPDLRILRRVGYPMAVADANPRVLAVSAFTTTRPGGHGAAREAVEHLLHAKGLLDRALKLYD